MNREEAVARAEAIAADPAAASDTDKLRSVADLLDALDSKDGGYRGHDVQGWLRDLADRLSPVDLDAWGMWNGKEETAWMLPHRALVDRLGVTDDLKRQLHTTLDEIYQHGHDDADEERVSEKSLSELIGERVLRDALRSLPMGTCRSCGCTDDDCSQCVERTGQPCHWVAADLCSACAAPS